MRQILQDEDWDKDAAWQTRDLFSSAGAAEASGGLDEALVGACLQQVAAAEGRGLKRPAPEALEAEQAADQLLGDPVELAKLVVEEQQ